MPQKHIHKHTLDLTANKILIALAVVMTVVVVLVCVINNQWQTIDQFRDNDLKYRYI